MAETAAEKATETTANCQTSSKGKTVEGREEKKRRKIEGKCLVEV